ncbi:hypothetical protein RND81_08G132000 [Saponaria officinalis]|uniref:BHLH domain-containing protein n=1 Tax=Saponaria officinalis TaxID=3572 RepID=A0AAW1J7G4_SAPOF
MSLLDNYAATNLDYSSYLLSNPFDFPTEADLLCFDPLPPSLFDFDLDFDVPVFTPPQFDLPYLPIEATYPYHNYEEYNYFNNNNYYFPKKQKFSYVPSFQGDNYSYNVGVGVGGGGGGGVKGVTAQSKAARERRRKITEKTQELGKLLPGGTKMNTAHMFQAAANYVKFLQAQLGLLNFINTLPTQESEKEANTSNIAILGSKLVQEKLYTKEKCLVPMDYIPILKTHLDPSISNNIDELFMH